MKHCWINEGHISLELRALHRLSIPNPGKDIKLICFVSTLKECEKV